MKIIERIGSMLNQKQSGLRIVILSGACCIPSMASFDKQAEQIIVRAITETGVKAQVKVVPATTAIFGGGVSKKIIGELMAMFDQGKISAPAILINGEVVSYGVPTLEKMKEALNKFPKQNKNE